MEPGIDCSLFVSDECKFRTLYFGDKHTFLEWCKHIMRWALTRDNKNLELSLDYRLLSRGHRQPVRDIILLLLGRDFIAVHLIFLQFDWFPPHVKLMNELTQIDKLISSLKKTDCVSRCIVMNILKFPRGEWVMRGVMKNISLSLSTSIENFHGRFNWIEIWEEKIVFFMKDRCDKEETWKFYENLI